MTGDKFEKVKNGIKDTAEEVKETAEKLTDPDTYPASPIITREKRESNPSDENK